MDGGGLDGGGLDGGGLDGGLRIEERISLAGNLAALNCQAGGVLRQERTRRRGVGMKIMIWLETNSFELNETIENKYKFVFNIFHSNVPNNRLSLPPLT